MSNELLERLKKIDIFSGLVSDDNRLLKIVEVMKKKKYPAGEDIIREGEIGNNLYILNKGMVKIFKSTLNNEKYMVARLGEDQNVFFGELALIDRDRRSATVTAESDCEVFSIDRKSYTEIAENDPLLGYKITLLIAKRISFTLRKMNNDVITLFEALVNEVKGDN